MNTLLLPICCLIGHDRPESEDKPGWFSIDCQRCGRAFGKPYWWQILRARIPYIFLWLANMFDDTPTHNPRFRAIDQKIKGIGTEHSCAAYSYEEIVSLLKQYEDDGLPPPLLKDLISEDGWVSIEDVGAEAFKDMLDKSFKAEANKQERYK